ncbi:MAG: hypothetical protein AAGI48_11700 [Verrucomicrobiota bacterium]
MGSVETNVDGITVTSLGTTVNSGRAIRMEVNPVDGSVFYVRSDGDIYELNPDTGSQTRMVEAADHGVVNPWGMAIGPDGTIYLVGWEWVSSDGILGLVQKGVPGESGYVWSRMATSMKYGKSPSFNHRFNAAIVTPDGQHLLVNSGSRTDHGEIQDGYGFVPAGSRETGLTAVILKIPTSASGLTLPDDRASLTASGYLFAEGLRNNFDLAYAPNGDLFGVENSGDIDLPEELNWLREGHHYGFPWRMGSEDNPQQFPGYDPDEDKLLNPGYTAVIQGLYVNDPTFPPAPAVMTDPIINLGPDADKFRDAADGLVKDASDLGVGLATFTSHRSPLGLCFDSEKVLSPEYRGDGFTLSWTSGNPNSSTGTGPFLDESEDLLHLDLEKAADGSGYVTRATTIATGFSGPIDSVMIGNEIIVMEWSGSRGIWKITLPTGEGTTSDLRLEISRDGGDATLKVTEFSGSELRLLRSHDLESWFVTDVIEITQQMMLDGEIEVTKSIASPGRLFYMATVSGEPPAP